MGIVNSFLKKHLFEYRNYAAFLNGQDIAYENYGRFFEKKLRKKLY